MRTDIVIVNFLMASDVARCLKNLGPWPHGTIWLVNNSAQEPGSAADNAMLQAIADERLDVTLLNAPDNLGFGRGCNLAYAHSTAEGVLLLNPDAAIDSHDLLQLIELLHERQDWGAVSPIMHWDPARRFVIPPSVAQTPAAALDLALSTRWSWWARWQAHKDLDRMRTFVEQSRPQPVDFLSGAVLLVRRAAALEASQQSGLAAADLFDPAFFMFFEDSDLSVRLRRAGWKLGVHPGLRAVHSYRHKPFKAVLMAQARLQYFQKQFPLFFRLTRALKWVDQLVRPVHAADRLQVIEPPLHSAAALSQHTAGAAVLAWSPSLLGRPAVFRSPETPSTPLDEADWALLEPGSYVALLQRIDGTCQWCCFECARPSGHLKTM